MKYQSVFHFLALEGLRKMESTLRKAAKSTFLSLTLAGPCIIHHTIQINQPTRCNSFTSLLLDVLCRSTCFERLHAHHQELTTALTASGFTLERGGSSLVGRGLAS
jgi:hypothetical protein